MPLADPTPDAWTWAVAVWLGAIGGVVGSFLNVVVYRVPAGLSIVRPGSHCPACKHPIRWHDNVPVLGWLLVRGRCRDCGVRVSLRYPAVEAAVAAVFFLLGLCELLAAGANLPLRPEGVPGGAILASLSAKEAAAVYVYHLVLWCTLLAAALMEYDGRGVPARVFVPALAWGLAAPLVWPCVHPVPVYGPAAGWTAGLADSAAGLAAGAALGGLVSLSGRRPACQDAAETAAPQAAIPAAALTGMFLGWQAALVVVGAAAVVDLPFRLAARRLRPTLAIVRIPFAAWLVVATPAWIVAWRALAAWWHGP